MKLNIDQLRKDFPILDQQINGRPLVYFDNAATTQKPLAVINSLSNYYRTINANVHRGNHFLSQQATSSYENARKTVADFIHAAHSEEIIFTRGTSESINMLAFIFGESEIKPGDEILISGMEHHSNIVPWQMLCERKGAILKIIPVSDSGELEGNPETYLTAKTRILALSHVSNTLGTINPVKQYIDAAHKRNIPVMLDGAQAAPHLSIDVQALDVDFYCFSGHKVYGPTGIGVLYGKKTWLNKLPPYQGGGEMIESVSFEKTTYNVLPYKFEAGTPNIADAIGLASALNYVNSFGVDVLASYEHELLSYATEKMSAVDGLQIIGTSDKKAAVISFVVDKTHPGDLGVLLDKMGVAVRVGTHCTEPLMQRFGLSGTARASFAMYNTFEEIDLFLAALRKAISMLQ